MTPGMKIIPAEQVFEARLLKAKQAKDLPGNILDVFGNSYWLEDPVEYTKNKAKDVVPDFNGNSRVLNLGTIVTTYLGVRPTLWCSSSYVEKLNLKLYEEVKIFGRDWIYIGLNGFLCSGLIGKSAFNRYLQDGNSYTGSLIERYVNSWFQKNKNTFSDNKILAISYGEDESLIEKAKLYESEITDWAFEQFNSNDAFKIQLINKNTSKEVFITRDDL